MALRTVLQRENVIVFYGQYESHMDEITLRKHPQFQVVFENDAFECKFPY